MTGPAGVFVGAATLDLHYLLPEMPPPDSKGPADAFGLYAGGPAANAAVTFSHLGGRATLLTEIGSHPLGEAIAADLRRRGVEIVDMIEGVPAVPMVSAIVTTAGSGDRMVIASRYPDSGASVGLPGDLPEATVLLVDGFLGPAALDAADQARARRMPVVLDAGSWKPALDDLLPLVDTAICAAGFRPPGVGSEQGVFDDLERRGVERIAVTRGGEPIRYRDGGEDGEVPVERVDPVDTLGAGDVLHGAFCHRFAAGMGFVEALTEAAALATDSVRSFGTRAWMDER